MAKPYDPKDFYYRKAKAEGLRARSAFKIEEIVRKHRLLTNGQAVLDLGAAPGGFLQILADAERFDRHDCAVNHLHVSGCLLHRPPGDDRARATR